MEAITWWSIASVALHVGLQVVLAFRVLMRRQPLANTHAWLLLVLFVPLIGMLLYLLVGENRLGSYRLKRIEAQGQAVKPLEDELWAFEKREWVDPEARFEHLARLGNQICDAPVLAGNDLTLLADSTQTLIAMIADIEHATSHCHLLTYIFQPDGMAEQVADALIRAAERGVECRVAVDGAGSRPFLRSHLPDRLRDAGVEVTELLPVNLARLALSRIDLRNHRKLLVIDGKIAYCGSQNLTDDSFKPSRIPGIGPWIDATVRMEGPVAKALALRFAADWNADAERPITDLERYLPSDTPVHQSEHASGVQVLASGPGHRPRAIQSAFVTTCYAAREELVLTTPYFVPDPSVLGALVSAASRGVDVYLVLPETNNQPLVAAAGRASYAELLEAGVRIMLYQPGLLHAKTITVDRHMALIGSANLDQRSFWINFELTLAVFDSDFASHLRMLQTEYIERSREIRHKDWIARPPWKRAGDSVAELFAPLL